MDQTYAYSVAYPIELLACNPIDLDEPAFQQALEKRLGQVARPKEPSDQIQLYYLQDYPVEIEDGMFPAQLALLRPNLGEDQQPRLARLAQDALHQSWSFRDAADIYKDCRHSLLLATMMGYLLSHDLRREIFINGLLALLETLRCDLVHWTPTQQMLSPADILSQYSEAEQLASPVYGFLNVRFFSITGSDDDMVMDTLGLTALGLTDLQIHFHKLNPNQVAQTLYDTGAYLFEQGDVIEDGHTIEGPDDSRWSCRREVSLLEPTREILDLNPGPEFAASR